MLAKGVVLEQYILITSQKIEEAGRSDWIIQAAGLPKIIKIRKIEIAAAKTKDLRDPLNPYYTGVWLEELLYHKTKEKFKQEEAYIACGVKLKLVNSNSTTDSDSEIEVLFVKDNRLYILECKCYSGKVLKGNQIYQPMYKLGAIQKNLGLHATCSLLIALNLAFGCKNKQNNDSLICLEVTETNLNELLWHGDQEKIEDILAKVWNLLI